MGLDVEVFNIQGVSIIKLGGRLDVDGHKALKDRAKALIEGGAKKILIDFEKVDFIDSDGLGTLISIARWVLKSGGALRFFSLQENVRDIFRLSRLDKIFEIHSDQSAALGSIR
jgi:anti-sigma B factor antagonist